MGEDNSSLDPVYGSPLQKPLLETAMGALK